MTQKRSNQQWLDELCGRQGTNARQQAHNDLANYLYIVAYNYLLQKSTGLNQRLGWTEEELASFAQDCVQDVLEKLMLDDFALLFTYQDKGRFTSWVAMIIRNHIIDLLRRPPFSKPHIALDSVSTLTSAAQALDDSVTHAEVMAALQLCLEQLSEQRRVALMRCIGHDDAAQVVAEAMDKTVIAVNLLVMRAKRQVKKCLAGSGMEKEVLSLYG